MITIKASCLTISKDIFRNIKDKAIYKGQRCNFFIKGKYYPSNIIDIFNSSFIEFDTIGEVDIEVLVDNHDLEEYFLLGKKFELREADNLLAMCVIKSKGEKSNPK